MSKYIFIYRNIFGYYVTELIKNNSEFIINNVTEFLNLEFNKLLSLLKITDNSVICSNINHNLSSCNLIINNCNNENVYYHYYKYDEKKFDVLLLEFLDKLNCNLVTFSTTQLLKFIEVKLNSIDCIKEHDSFICSLILAFKSTEMFFSVDYIEDLKLKKAIEHGCNSILEFEDRYKTKLSYSVVTGVTIQNRSNTF